MNKQVEQIKAEIERRYHNAINESKYMNGMLFVRNELENLREFVYSLPQEQPEVDEDFYFDEVLKVYNDNNKYPPRSEEELTMLEIIARHFYELGKQAQKEQMLKDAVEGVAEELYNDGESQCTVGVGTYFKPSEEVYVIKKED